MLTDQYGRPLKKPATAELTQEIAAPGMGSVRHIESGHPADGITPVQLAGLLREAETGDATRYLELAEQMEEKDLHYSAVLAVRKRAIRKLDIHVDAASEDARDEDAAQLLRDELGRPSIKDDLISMLDALGKGYSATEIIWNAPTASQWTINRLEHRDPRWFRFDRDNGRTPLIRSNAAIGDPLPFGKFVFHTSEAKSGLPIRAGLARIAAWGFLFKNFSLRDWAIFVEAYGHPLRVGKYGPNASEEDKRTLLRAVRMIGTDLAAIVPQGMEMEIIQSQAGADAELYERKARYWDEQISKAVLGQVSTTDAIAGGHAVGSIHNEVREDIRDADAEQLASTLMRDIAVPLTVFNFGPETGVPRIRIEAPEDFDADMMLKAAETFGPRGLRIPVSHVRRTFGIPEPQDGEEVLDFATPAPAAPTELRLPADPQEKLTAALQRRPASGSLDRLADHAATSLRTGEAVNPMLDALLEAIGQAADFTEVEDILSQFQNSVPPDALRQIMAEVLNAARLAGETGAAVDA